jgi:hypothetical protein
MSSLFTPVFYYLSPSNPAANCQVFFPHLPAQRKPHFLKVLTLVYGGQIWHFGTDLTGFFVEQEVKEKGGGGQEAWKAADTTCHMCSEGLI